MLEAEWPVAGAGLGGLGAGGRMAAHVVSFNSVEVPGPYYVHGDRGDCPLFNQMHMPAAYLSGAVHNFCQGAFQSLR